MKIKFNGIVSEQGVTTIYDRYKFHNELQMFAGKEITITVEPLKRKRSDGQNKYYWKILLPYVREGLIETGVEISIPETHEFLKMNFASHHVVNEKTGELVLDKEGNPMSMPRSTAQMTTINFMNFKERIQQWASEYLNIYIPDPNEQTQIEL